MKKTEYETVQETAERFGVTVRAVQKWASNGRIPGAVKSGRSWKIPKGTDVLESVPEFYDKNIPNELYDVYRITPFRVALPLMNSSYPVGRCLEYINNIPDQDDRQIALGEYYFYSGRSEEATKVLEPYLNSHDPSLRYSANLIAIFANLSIGHVHITKFAGQNLKEQVRRGLMTDAPPNLHAIGIFTSTAASVLFHTPLRELPPLENYLKYLSGGVKLYACYILAHKAYLKKDYSRQLAIAELGIALSPQEFPVPLIYTHLVAAMALVNLRRVEEARHHLSAAWKIAEPDGILEPFGQHHGLLGGMIEVFFKKDHPKEFKKITDITYSFSAGWRKIHNDDNGRDVADNLSTLEFTIAMLFSRGWSYKEIAGHLDISERNVSKRVADIYVKLGVNNRTALAQFMLI